jgi:hypothetical protein
VLREIGRIGGLALRNHAEDGGELVAIAGQFLERHADLIPGVEPQIEAQLGLGRSHRTRQRLARFLRIQRRLIGGGESGLDAGRFTRDRFLCPERPGGSQQHHAAT